MHAGTRDEIYAGFDKEFGWGAYRVEVTDVEAYGEEDSEKVEFWKHFGAICQIPKTTLGDLCRFFKDKAFGCGSFCDFKRKYTEISGQKKKNNVK